MRDWLVPRSSASGISPFSVRLTPVPTAEHESPRPGSLNRNPPSIGLLSLLAEDYVTHGRSVLEPGLWAVVVHRLGNARMDIHPRVRAPFSVAYEVMRKAVSWGFGIDLCYSVKLGRRVRLWHHGGMVLGARSIGDDVHIRQNTTFGLLHRTALDEKPTIGDRVDVGAGACVLGGIVVGSDVVIGANSVVVRDVPPSTTVFGVPARPVAVRSPGEPFPSKPRAA